MMRKLLALGLALGMSAAIAPDADALFLDPGSRLDISSVFGQGASIVNSSQAVVAFTSPNAAAVDFNVANTSSLGSATVNVTGATGTFASFILGPTSGTINGFSFNPFSTVAPLYTIASLPGVTFDLTGITSVVASATSFEINGTGRFTIGGDVTLGLFTFTTQNAAGNAGTNLSFSANSVAVPEPATMAILGAGLLGLGLARRRKAA